MPDDQVAGAVWVRSDLAADGTYIVTVEYGPDHSRPMDRDTATRYATAALDACQRAEYDAAVLAQLTGRPQLTDQNAAAFIAGLRLDRPPLDSAALAPLDLVPGISMTTRRPFLGLYLDGRPVGQWDIADGRQHALHVLDAIAAADLDGAYYRHLVSFMDVDPDRARNVVYDLANHRDTTEDTNA